MAEKNENDEQAEVEEPEAPADEFIQEVLVEDVNRMSPTGKTGAV